MPKKTKIIRDKKTGRILGSEKGITPDELLAAFEAYMVYVKANPKIKYQANTKENTIIPVPMEVPYTKNGFYVYCMKNKITGSASDIVCNRDGRFEEFKEVNAYIDAVCYSDCLDGAMANVFNANIVARKLHLAEKQEIKTEEETKITFVKPKQNDRK